MICTVVPTITTSTQVTITPVSISIFFCGSLRSRPKTAKPTSTVAAMPTSTPVQHGRDVGREHERLHEEDGLEALAVDAREAERRERGELGEGDAAGRQHGLLLAVQPGQVPRPVGLVEEPVEDHEQHADRYQPDDRRELLAVAREAREDRLRDHPGGGARDERRADAEPHRAPQAALRRP